MRRHHRLALAATAALGLLAPLLPAATAAATPAPPAPLTDLAHLDSLTTTVRPPVLPGHRTYGQQAEPGLGVLWVYADRTADGSYRPTGGGAYDPVRDTYGQGAYDADDIARAAVVYLRHWRADGDAHSRDEARQLLRGLTYLQTSAGPDAGNVVLWMQPDGTLNPSPTPKDSPDPSDAGASYWLARTVWALGEGYAAFEGGDPGFAAFLRARLDLAVTALRREVLVRYGTYRIVHGVRVPAWLIADGADASAEAVLGLGAYLGTPAGRADRAARTALSQLSDGIAAMGAGGPRQWPYGALLPWALSRSDWHAWAAQMPAALAVAAGALHRPELLRSAVPDAAVFTPALLTASGPDNGWLPTPADGSQIAYGADARVHGLLAVASATGSPGLRQLAGIAAGWFFGQNPAGVAMYDPSTGVTFDGVGADGQVNRNSGAESTIHGLLTMEALDADPELAALARAAARIVHRDGQRVVEAESAIPGGAASVVRPTSAWTGEAQWSGGAYVAAGPGSTLTWHLPAADRPRLLQPVALLTAGSAATTRFATARGPLGVLRYGAVGTQGDAPAAGELLPVTLPVEIPAGAGTVTATTAGGTGDLDALLVAPEVAELVTAGGGHAVALLHSAARTASTVTVELPGSGAAVARSYDASGRLRHTAVLGADAPVAVTVPAGGFAVVTR